LSTDVSHFRWFSLGLAVNFAVSFFLLSAYLRLVWALNGKLLWSGNCPDSKQTIYTKLLTDSHEEAAHIQVQDFLMNGVRRVNWTSVYDTLRGERRTSGKVDELTELACSLLQSADWQSIVADAEYLTQADDMLREWLQDQCITWVESPDARMYQSQVAVFANRVLEIYFGVVKWKQVASALRSE
jgi:hypothetical protein